MGYVQRTVYTLSWCVLIAANMDYASAESASTLAQQGIALDMITDTAAELCETVEQTGTTESAEVSGTVNVELNKLMRKFIDLGLEGAGQYKTEKWEGVLQQDLAALLKAKVNCNVEVLKTLQDSLLPTREDGSLPENRRTLLDALSNYRYEFGWSDAPRGTVDKQFNAAPITHVQAEGDNFAVLRYARSRGDGTLRVGIGERSLIGSWQDFEGKGEITLVFDESFSRATGWWNYGGYTQQYNAFMRRVE